MVISSSNDSNSAYSNIFRGYIVRNTEFALRRVKKATYSLSVEDQKLVFKTLDYALKYDETWPVTRDLLMSVAPKMEQAGYRGEWVAYLESGIEQSQQQEDLFAEAVLHFNVGILQQRQANFEMARRKFHCSALQFQKVGNQLEEARALNRLAYVARLQRRFEEAKQILKRAQILAKDDVAQAAYNDLVHGSMALDQRDWQNAAFFFRRSLSLWKKTKDKRMIAWGLTNLGTALRVVKKHDEAISSYHEAISLFEEIKDPVHQAVAQMNLGNAYLDLGEAQKALQFYKLSESIFYDTQAWLRFAKVNLNKAIAYQDLEQWTQAECAYFSGIEQLRKIGSISAMIKGLISLAEMYIEQGQHKKADETLQQARRELGQIEDELGYDDFLNTITTMLNDLF